MMCCLLEEVLMVRLGSWGSNGSKAKVVIFLRVTSNFGNYLRDSMNSF